jgi:putative ABC transport system substrate-binding protein
MQSDQLKRREFITLLGGAAAWPLAARAQQDRIRSVGVLSGSAEDDPNNRAWFAAFDKGLQDLGWVESRNILITRRFAPGDLDRTRIYAKELVALRPDLIFVTNTPAATAVLQETHSIPLLFVNLSDPLGSGLVSSMAHPGGNATGFTNFEFTIGGKWVQLMKEAAPNTQRVAVIFNPQTAPYAQHYVLPARAAADALRIELVTAPVRERDQLESVFIKQTEFPGGSILIIPDSFTVVNRQRIVLLSVRYRLPTIFPYRTFALDGGLIVYGTDVIDLYRRSALYVDRILHGEKPGDLPVQQPTKFELVVNLNTAKVLGLEIPSSILARANEVIE